MTPKPKAPGPPLPPPRGQASGAAYHGADPNMRRARPRVSPEMRQIRPPRSSTPPGQPACRHLPGGTIPADPPGEPNSYGPS